MWVRHPKALLTPPPDPQIPPPINPNLQHGVGVVVGFDVVEPHDAGQIRGAIVGTGQLGLLVQVADLLRREGGLQHVLHNGGGDTAVSQHVWGGHKATPSPPFPRIGAAAHRDVLQRGVNDLVVVGQAVELQGVQVEEDVVAELHAVDVGVRLQAPACGREGASGPKPPPQKTKQRVGGLRCPSQHTELTLEVFPTHQAGVDVDVGQRDGAQLLEVKIQHAPARRAQLWGGGRGDPPAVPISPLRPLPTSGCPPSPPTSHLLMVSR